MLRLYRILHDGAPRYAADRDGTWRLVDGDVVRPVHGIRG